MFDSVTRDALSLSCNYRLAKHVIGCPFAARSVDVPLMKKKMHISQLYKAVERGEFSIKFVSSDGEVIYIDRCICTSFHSSGQTMNVKLCESGEVRKINRYTIVELNGQELHL